MRDATMTQAERDELRRLHAAASPGPWHAEPRYSNGCEVCPRIVGQDRWIADVIGAPYLGHKDTHPNAAYIVAACNALPQLLADVERLEAEAAICRRVANQEFWVWQGDGYDFPESIACPVMMQPATLRGLLADVELLKSESWQASKLLGDIFSLRAALEEIAALDDVDADHAMGIARRALACSSSGEGAGS